jgi:Fe-S-cluster containining protein
MSTFPRDAALIQIVDAALASAVLRSGPHLVCRPGCSQCCHGVFEISALDAQRLRDGLELLTRTDPVRAQQVHARLGAAREHLTPWFPGDATTGVLTDDEDAVELFEEFAHADACPLLDPATQTCDLYEHRPILCRTFGPPMRNEFGGEDSAIAICELCFTAATPEEIAAAEMDSGFRPLEHQLEAGYMAANPHAGRTLVAFAFPAASNEQ